MSLPLWLDDARQEAIDRYYWENGPCCAGCDWWASHNSVVGECRKSAPVSARERTAMLGLQAVSLEVGAGHVMTQRDHHCGDFKDEFDWSSLPEPYLRKVAAQR